MRQSTIGPLTEDALDAFWQVVARRFPEAKTGDLSIDRDVKLSIAANAAVQEWIENNVPDVNTEDTPSEGVEP